MDTDTCFDFWKITALKYKLPVCEKQTGSLYFILFYFIKKSFDIFSSLRCQRFKGRAAHFGRIACHQLGITRLITLAAIRHRRQIR